MGNKCMKKKTRSISSHWVSASQIHKCVISLIRRTISDRRKHSKGWLECGNKENVHTLSVRMETTGHTLWRIVQKFLRKMKIELPYNLAILFLSTDREVK